MSDVKKVTFQEAQAFASVLRQALERIRAESQDDRIKDYVDYLLKDDRHDSK